MIFRSTIFRSAEIEKLERKSHGNFSRRMSDICDRYSAIIRLEYPVKLFTFPEMEMLKECFSGKILRPAGLIRNLVPEVEDAIKLHMLDNKYEIDSKKLIAKLKKLNYSQNVSLIEHIEEYWDSNEKE